MLRHSGTRHSVVLHRTRLASSTVSPLRRAQRETSLPASNADRRRIKTSGIHSQGSHFEKGSCVRARSAQELPGGLGELARTFSHHGKQAVPPQSTSRRSSHDDPPHCLGTREGIRARSWAIERIFFCCQNGATRVLKCAWRPGVEAAQHRK